MKIVLKSLLRTHLNGSGSNINITGIIFIDLPSLGCTTKSYNEKLNNHIDGAGAEDGKKNLLN